MYAVIAEKYGEPEHVLQYTEFEDPALSEGHVLLHVHNIGVNPVDRAMLAGNFAGSVDLEFPYIPGWDVAGEVLRVGEGVTHFRVGDQVLGYGGRWPRWGTYAEYAAPSAETLAHKPGDMSWEEAGALPLAGLAAYQALIAARVSEGGTVLIHGATGGVGSMATQIAVAHGNRVIGTTNQQNFEYLRSLGGIPVQYGSGLMERVREIAPQLDAAVELVSDDTVKETRQLITPRDEDVPIFSSLVDSSVSDADGAFVETQANTDDLKALTDLYGRGKLRIEVAAVYPLSQAARALTQLKQGGTRGKLVLDATVR